MKIYKTNTITNNKINVSAKNHSIAITKVMYNLNDSFSFTGNTAELKIPTKEFKKLLSKAYKEIKNTKDLKEKEKLIENNISFLKQFLHDSFKQMKHPNEWGSHGNTVYGEFGHDINNILRVNVKNKTNKEIDKEVKKSFSLLIKNCKDYQFLLDTKCFINNSNSEVLDFVINQLNKMAKHKQIKINVQNKELLNQDPLPIYLPQYLLYSIFHNVIQNAIKYNSKRGKIDIVVEKYQRQIKNSFFETLKEEGKKPDHRVPEMVEQSGIKFIITDTGMGIPQKEQEKVLQGERASNAIESGITGSGSGLKKVNKILGLMSKGNIEIKSPATQDIKNPGTQISCYFPTYETDHFINNL